MTLDALLADCQSLRGHSAEYADKMLHRVPSAGVVDRAAFIAEACRGRVVLNIGSASGGLHSLIQSVAKEAIGLDKDEGPNTDIVYDLDGDFRGDSMLWPSADLIVMGEVLEHLSNPGHLLDWFKTYGCEVLITVPNAFSRGAQRDGYEVVNRDHVCWYSWKTLTVLLERHGFEIIEWHWYNGQPLTAEGLVFVAR